MKQVTVTVALVAMISTTAMYTASTVRYFTGLIHNQIHVTKSDPIGMGIRG